jgi:hypothetical protein
VPAMYSAKSELNNFVFRFQLFERFIGQHFAFVSDGRRRPP